MLGLAGALGCGASTQTEAATGGDAAGRFGDAVGGGPLDGAADVSRAPGDGTSPRSSPDGARAGSDVLATTDDVARPAARVTALAPCEGPAPPIPAGALGPIRPTTGPGRHHAAACGRVVWATPDGGLRLVDARARAPQDLLPSGSGAAWPDVDGPVAVATVGEPPQVVAFRLDTGAVELLDPTGSAQRRPRISAARVVWEDERGSGARLRWLDRATGALGWVADGPAEQRFAALVGDRVVWTDLREDADGVWTGDGSDQADLWSAVGGGAAAPLVQAPFKQAFPEVAGDDLIWLDWRNVLHDARGQPRPEPKLAAFEVWRGSMAGGAVLDAAPIAVVMGGVYAGLPTIAGGWVAWAHADGDSHAVTGVQLALGKVVRLSPEGLDADAPALAIGALLFRGGPDLIARALP